MRTLPFAILTFAFTPLLLLAQPEARTVHLGPDTDAPVIGLLPSGSVMLPPLPPVSMSERAQAEGWAAISFLDNFRGFVLRSQIRKDLTLATDTPIYLSAQEDSSQILALAQARDVVEVQNVDGLWAEVSFRKPVTGFVQEVGHRASPAAVNRPPAGSGAVRPQPQPLRETIAADTVRDARDTPSDNVRAARRGRIAPPPTHSPIPTEVFVDSGPPVLRAFEGWLSPTRSFFGRSQPFSHQIIDQAGNRIAYLDLSRLLITTPLDEFYGLRFEFYGRSEAIPERRDFVIRVERILQQ
jgi:hypothetical protein